MSEFDPKESKHPATPGRAETMPGATGIFSAISPEQQQSGGSSPGAAPVLSSQVQPQVPAGVPQVRTGSSPVLVHEVKFQAEREGASEQDQSLQRLMQSLPHTQAPAVSAVSDFTQLLSALQGGPEQTTQPAQVPAEKPLQVAPVPQPVAPPSALRQNAPFEPSSFTRLFEALAPQPSVKEAAPPEPLSFAGFQAEPIRPENGAAKEDPASAIVPGVPTVVPPSIGQSPAAPARDAASFTQLFAALGQAPKPEPNQAADYPPIHTAKPNAARPNLAPLPTYSVEQNLPTANPAHSIPLPGAGTESRSDLNSLTQLLRALEEVPAGNQVSVPAVLPPTQAEKARAGAGATVAFTPPESVQRLAAQRPPAPSGPGDFTRILQASALRESGIGSQAAAAHSVPEVQHASAAPSPIAGAALPPWSAPPMPHIPQMPQISHMNSNVPGPGPVPGFHAATPSAFMPPPAAIPREAQHAAAATRPQTNLLLIVLMAIIVILIGVLVALLLRR